MINRSQGWLLCSVGIPEQAIKDEYFYGINNSLMSLFSLARFMYRTKKYGIYRAIFLHSGAANATDAIAYDAVNGILYYSGYNILRWNPVTQGAWVMALSGLTPAYTGNTPIEYYAGHGIILSATTNGMANGLPCRNFNGARTMINAIPSAIYGLFILIHDI
jgi:hypothetical protein